MTRLIQIRKSDVRCVALVEEPYLRLLSDCSSIYTMAKDAISSGMKLSEVARQRSTRDLLEYNPVHNGTSDWRVLPAIDHPEESARCLVSGTGLTHLGSACDRQAMHNITTDKLTDSMKMFRWGVEGGQPTLGHIGVAPEWFYKGTGTMLRAHREPLDIPSYAEDGRKRLKSPASISLGPTAGRIVLGWLPVMNFPIIVLKRGIT